MQKVFKKLKLVIFAVSWDRYKKAGQHKNTGQYKKADQFEHVGWYKKTDQNRKEGQYRKVGWSKMARMCNKKISTGTAGLRNRLVQERRACERRLI